MDKIKLEFEAPSAVTTMYNGKIIVVDPILTLEKQIFLIERYVNEYLNLEGDTGSSYMNAEINHRNYVFQLNTNIDTENIDPNILMDEALWDKICSLIPFYWILRDRIDTVIRDKREDVALENSVGKVLSGLADKLSVLMDNFSNITPEEIKSLQDKSAELVDQLQKSSNSLTSPKKITRKKA